MVNASRAKETGPLLLKVKEVAEQLGLSEWQVRGLTEDGTLPAARVKGRIYIPAESVRDYVADIVRSA